MTLKIGKRWYRALPNGVRKGYATFRAANQGPIKVHIRWMISRDMPEVLKIEYASFAEPWCEEDFLRCLRQRNCIGMAVEHGEKVIGSMIYELHKYRLHVLNMAVHPKWRGLGVGKAMVAKLIGKLSSHRRTAVTFDVREDFLNALLFLKSQGFIAVRINHGDEFDSFRMKYSFGSDEGFEPVNRIAQYEENEA